MERFRDVLLEVWREACRHIEIQESANTIARMLGRHFPVSGLLLRRFDFPQRTLDTVAEGGTVSRFVTWPARTQLPPPPMRRWAAWAARNEVLQGRRDRKPPVDFKHFVPGELAGDTLVGPLCGPDGLSGVLVLTADPQRAFAAEHLRMAGSLLEPSLAALENDRRMHELAALREAAEADRRSLLSRLGREDVNDPIVGSESGLRQVMERVELVSGSDVPILILGETGTGKEVVSRAIHVRSARSSGPFIRVNCGAIPPELLDSQLFGHEKGSFTGAAETRKGWFERADGGTLFLDEIGELPLAAQVRLLRVLQDGFIERVGAQQAVRVDVRIVAATHRDLASMVKAGSFREDLWYRINVFPILLPRLQERMEDIPALARHLAQRAARRYGVTFVEPTPEDLGIMMNYSWPGNIRELGAVIDRAAILGNGKRLEVAKALGFNAPRARPPVTPDVTLYEVIPEITQPLVPPSAEPSGSINSLDSAMKLHIERALVATRGRIEGGRGTAVLLGINPHTLRARMRKLRIDWSRFRDDDVNPSRKHGTT